MQDPELLKRLSKQIAQNWLLVVTLQPLLYNQNEEGQIIESFGGLNQILAYSDYKLQSYYKATAEIVGNGTVVMNSETLPLRNEVVAGMLAFPELITDSIAVYTAIDTAFDSPFYGNLRILLADLAPRNTSKVGKGKYINRINNEAFYGKLVESYSKD